MKKILKKVATKYVDTLQKALSGEDDEMKGGRAPKSKMVEKEHSMVVNRLPGYFLIFSIVGVFYLLLTIIEPFLTILLVAAILTILFYGMYEWILKKFHGMSRLSALLSCFIVIFIIVVPLIGFVILLAREGLEMYDTVSTMIANGDLDAFFKWEEGGWIFDLKESLKPAVNLDSIDIKSMIIDSAQNVSTFLVSQSAVIVKNFGTIVVSFFIMLFSMYYLFKDGEKIVDKLTVISPLPRKYENEIIKRIAETVKAIAFGTFLTAFIQGILAGIGFAIVGVSNPVFWGAATGLFSLIPLIGTSAIWGPASILLLLFGNYFGGVFLMIWGLFVVGTVDNLVRPYLIGTRSKTYPLLTFFVVLGGIWTFGLKGLIFGPIVLILLITLLHVYELEYKNVLSK
jgi:predicted PurR-regulated permease PerM